MQQRSLVCVALVCILASVVRSETYSGTIWTAKARALDTQRFASTTIDISQLVDQHLCNFSDPVFHNLAHSLKYAYPIAPSYLRIGGTRGDQTYYNLTSEATSQLPEPPANFHRVLTKGLWDYIVTFAQDAGFQVLFGVNAGVGPRNGIATQPWNPSNALELMEYNKQMNYPIAGYEFANEPNLFGRAFGKNASVPVDQFAKDLQLFRSVVKKVDSSVLVISPDIDYVPLVGEIVPYMEPLLSRSGSVVDVVTWHFYPMFNWKYNGSFPGNFLQATLENAMNPIILSQVSSWTGDVLEPLVAKYAPQAQVRGLYKNCLWLGETGSAVGGGQPDISNRFVDAFEYLSKLGSLSAESQTQVVLRQTLCGYNYGLIDWTLRPNPSYFAMYLFKNLTSSAAMPVSLTSGRQESILRSGKASTARVETLKAFAYCSRSSVRNAVVMVLNLGSTEVSLSLRMDVGTGTPLSRRSYVLTGEGGALDSDTVVLNGHTPLMTNPDGTMPVIQPDVSYDATQSDLWTSTWPPYSYGFLEYVGVDIPACSSA